MCDFQVRLDERERPSCVKEAEMSSLLSFIETGGKYGLSLCETTTCVILLSLNETWLSLPPILDL